MTLDELGQRICIIGPSNSGKSTLATAIGRARGLVPIHLDQLHHYPHTNWQPRPEQEFLALHEQAIKGPSWVIDGNYLRYLPQRLAHATGLIFLDASAATCLLRYFRRTWFESERRGGLPGAPERVTWEMIHYIAFASGGGRHNTLFARAEIPKIRLATQQELSEFYHLEGLSR